MPQAVLQAVLQANTEQGDYDALPDAVRQYYTPRQWSVLSDAQKADLVRSECEPDEC